MSFYVTRVGRPRGVDEPGHCILSTHRLCPLMGGNVWAPTHRARWEGKGDLICGAFLLGLSVFLLAKGEGVLVVELSADYLVWI